MRGKRKHKIGPKQREYVQRVTRSILETMLEFKMRYDVTNYLIEKTRLDWRSIESDLYTKSPIKAKGLVFRNSENEPQSGVEFANELLPPEKIVEYLGEFPMDAAAANYIFTLLEIYGDLIVQKTNKKFFENKNRFTNWHHKVFGDAETQDRNVLVKMANGFGEPFLVAGKEIDNGVVLKLIELKRARNEFAHDADEDHRFDVLFEYAVVVIYEIYFLLCPEENMLIVDPFEGTSDELDEARYDQRIFQEIAEEENED
jgi:hypothetical protein